MVVDGTKGDSRAYHVLALVTKRQKAGDEGKPEASSASIAILTVQMSKCPRSHPDGPQSCQRDPSKTLLGK